MCLLSSYLGHLEFPRQRTPLEGWSDELGETLEWSDLEWGEQAVGSRDFNEPDAAVTAEFVRVLCVEVHFVDSTLAHYAVVDALYLPNLCQETTGEDLGEDLGVSIEFLSEWMVHHVATEP